MTAWKKYRLGDFTEINPRISLKQGNEYSFVEMKDLDAMLKYVSPSTKKELKGGSKFENGDTLFARITPCLENGKICQAKNLENNVGFGSTEFLVFRGKREISDTNFVYYLTKNDYVKNKAIQMMTGTSGRQRVEKSALENLEIFAPDLPTQTRIAQILTSFDDKIELLGQMNQTLETMAQTIFKEWFIDFNFPGFDEELVDGLPKGWRKGKLGEIVDKISKGTTPTQKDLENLEVSVPFLKVKDINDNGIVSIENVEFIPVEVHNKQLKRSILETNDILFSIAGTIGRVAILDNSLNNSNCNQAIAFIRLKDKEKHLEFVYLWLKNEIIQNFINSSIVQGVQANVSLTVLNNIDIIIPDQINICYWINVIKPIFSKITNNQHQIRTLTHLRDTLLPKLMSGAVKVE